MITATLSPIKYICSCPGNLHLEFTYSRITQYDVIFRIDEIFLVFDKDQEREIRFNENDTVSLHEDITNLILRVSLQAGITLLPVYISSPFCRSGKI